MSGPLKNARHERFAQEYLLDLDAIRAAHACGIELKTKGAGFYVYFLIDQRSGSIFYVGKGKGDRLRFHRRQAENIDSVNQVKAQRIIECGSDLAELVFVDALDEVSAFRIEKELIAALRDVGLANISSGSIHPLESVLASIDRGMGMIRHYDDWVRYAAPSQIAAAAKLSGSPEAFYRDFWDKFYNLRAHVIRELNSIKEKSNGTAGR